MKCVVGRWRESLDEADLEALDGFKATRVQLHEVICEAAGRKPFSLTALKDHLNGRCICRLGELSWAS